MCSVIGLNFFVWSLRTVRHGCSCLCFVCLSKPFRLRPSDVVPWWFTVGSHLQMLYVVQLEYFFISFLTDLFVGIILVSPSHLMFWPLFTHKLFKTFFPKIRYTIFLLYCIFLECLNLLVINLVQMRVEPSHVEPCSGPFLHIFITKLTVYTPNIIRLWQHTANIPYQCQS